MAKELYIGPDKDDVRKRLVDTICRYKGEPVYVFSNAEHILTAAYLTNTSKAFQVDYREADFDYKSPPLGYCQKDERAVYLFRIPDRQNQRQGLTKQTLAAQDGSSTRELWASTPLRDCIMGTHKTVGEALEMLEGGDGYESIPVSRHIAVVNERGGVLGLHFRSRLVGFKERNGFRLIQSMESSIIEPVIFKSGIQLVA